MVAKGSLGDSVQAGGGRAGAVDVALVDPRRHRLFEASVNIALGRFLHRFPRLGSQSLTSTRALKAGEEQGVVEISKTILFSPAVICAIASCQEARICCERHLSYLT